ncbi:SDR family oxidoreductase [Winogradskya consettensis]|uniref:3-beta hydroxysteroid dehydrogenase n=1 Tax=Winogradskya consettensis TaxID=113560 RepID=A0A919SM32_9ACTN|nr:SDR family oxidoreductase [Actinoplanes consettensis]GIM73418.1 3-beta hydroxysteroid dehydrogenase [Actinoplanes consettensis]
MRVFVTGASGHIGSAVVIELLGAGHQVVGLARSDSAAAAITAAGAEVQRGDLRDLDVLRTAAAASDGVIHLAFEQLTADMAESLGTDLRAIGAIGAVLAGSGKPFVGTNASMTLSFLGGINDRPATEQDVMPGGPRADAENTVIALAENGVRSSVVRVPPLVHSEHDRSGLFPMLVGIARSRGVAGYIGDGSNRWPAVHTLDIARLYRLAIEGAPAGSRLHAVAEDGLTFRELADVIAGKLGVKAGSVAPEDFGPLAMFVALDNPMSSEGTRRLLGWQPAGPTQAEDLGRGFYFTS